MADDYFALVRHQVWCLDVFDGYPVEFDIILEREPGQQPEYTYSFTFCIPENTYTEWCKSRPVEFAQLRQFDIDHERKDKPCLHK